MAAVVELVVRGPEFTYENTRCGADGPGHGVAIMVSMVAFLDSGVVNLAVPAIKRDLGGGLATQQWVVDGLPAGATILPGGRSCGSGWRPSGRA